MVHWHICKKNNICTKKSWYNHRPAKVVENDNAKILGDVIPQIIVIVEKRVDIDITILG